MTPAAGETPALREVAATTRRIGARGESPLTVMSSRTLVRASSGISATPTPAATRPCTVW